MLVQSEKIIEAHGGKLGEQMAKGAELDQLIRQEYEF
jgi:hypothetical protein